MLLRQRPGREPAAAPPRRAVGEDCLEIARKSLVFQGFSGREVDELVGRLGGRLSSFGRGESLVTGLTDCTSAGIVLAGAAFSCVLDASGQRHVIAALGTGDAFAHCRLADDAFGVEGAAAGRGLILGTDKVTLARRAPDGLTARLAENLLRVAAAHGRALADKLALAATRSLRERILLFLQQEAARWGRCQFTIAFSRAELADYLMVDRSALSRELGRMREERLIDFHRDSFVVTDKACSSGT